MENNNTENQNVNAVGNLSEEILRAADRPEENNGEKADMFINQSADGMSAEISETDADINESGAEEDIEQEAPEEKKKRSKGMEALSWVRDIAIAIIIALVISQFITPTIVQEHSMDDTLHGGDYLILWKMAYKFDKEPEYGDIVVFKSDLVDQDNHKKLLIKRVIAVGGDTISISDGVVYRNGEPLDEPYTKDGFTNGGLDETVVPEGELFLMGDNRVSSRDSRDSAIGFVNEDLLIGKAVLRLFPFNKIGSVYGSEEQS